MERAYAGDEPRGLLTGDELLRMPWLNPCELVGGRVIAPELVVEILSPTDRRDEVQRKLREYFAAGVRVVWVVDPLSVRCASTLRTASRGDSQPATC